MLKCGPTAQAALKTNTTLIALGAVHRRIRSLHECVGSLSHQRGTPRCRWDRWWGGIVRL